MTMNDSKDNAENDIVHSSNVIYLAAYLNSKRDEHKDIQLEADSYEYIKDYCCSIKKNNLYCVIIVDKCTDKFMNLYTDKNISFYKQDYDLDGNRLSKVHDNMLLHDRRFLMFYNYITKKIMTCRVIVNFQTSNFSCPPNSFKKPHNQSIVTNYVILSILLNDIDNC